LNGKSIGVAHAMIDDEIQKQFYAKNDLGTATPKQIELARKFGFEKREREQARCGCGDHGHHVSAKSRCDHSTAARAWGQGNKQA
jgi:hypothetical protein